MTLTTSACWLFWLFVVFKISPSEATWFASAAFFTTLSLALVGTLSTLGFLMRTIAHKQSTMHARVLISFRQAVLLTSVLIVSMALLHMQLFTLMNTGILVVLAALVELVSIKITK